MRRSPLKSFTVRLTSGEVVELPRWFLEGVAKELTVVKKRRVKGPPTVEPEPLDRSARPRVRCPRCGRVLTACFIRIHQAGTGCQPKE